VVIKRGGRRCRVVVRAVGPGARRAIFEVGNRFVGPITDEGNRTRVAAERRARQTQAMRCHAESRLQRRTPGAIFATMVDLVEDNEGAKSPKTARGVRVYGSRLESTAASSTCSRPPPSTPHQIVPSGVASVVHVARTTHSPISKKRRILACADCGRTHRGPRRADNCAERSDHSR